MDPERLTAPLSENGTMFGLDEQDLARFKARFEQEAGPLGIDGPALLDRIANASSIAQALGVAPKLLDALYGRALQMLEIGQSTHARDLFWLLCALDGKQPDYWLGYGICLLAGDEFHLAQIALDLAARLAPQSPAPHLHRLCLFMRQQRWEAARRALDLLDAKAVNAEDAALLSAASPFRTALARRGA